MQHPHTDDDHCLECDSILAALEDVDDEADSYGVDFVKNKEVSAARQYGVYSTPALVYFRKKVPIFYDGDLHESQVVSTCMYFCICSKLDVFFLGSGMVDFSRRLRVEGRDRRGQQEDVGETSRRK